jgi:phage terminase large subunit-like protein
MASSDAAARTEALCTLLGTWQALARPSQLRPVGCARTWRIRSGRGWGKSRVLCEYGLDVMEDEPRTRGLIASRTIDEVLETLLRGPSGLNACARRRGYELEFVASRGPGGTIVHPNGAELRVGSGDMLDGVRGPNLWVALCDEIESWRYGPEVLASIEFALRAGPNPHLVAVGTPSWTSRVRFDDDDTTLATGTMEDNAANLAPRVVAELRRKYAGSKLGRQELLGEIVAVDGALVDLDTIHGARVREVPPGLERIAIGVDPSVAARIDRDAIGIVVVGVIGEHLFVLEDATVPGCRINEWARHVVDVYIRRAAGSILVELNQGGDANVFAIEQAARHAQSRVSIVGVHARGTKRDRHERVLGPLYGQGRVHHVGILEGLERELTTWTGRGKSPDRIDALSMAVEHLADDGDRHLTIASLYADEPDDARAFDDAWRWRG